ncbi:MAG: hypothetical protein FJ405_10080 [Verrucomicrobia bacterium]|nr:hypothetical protein [Verrucomicrobiota bacterium]
MRTKTLLLTAALSAASLLSSMAAGVTSVNVVGYINVSVPAGFSFIANQLVGSSSKLSDLIPNPPDETVIYTWDNGFASNGYNLFGDSTWENGDITLTPGAGALVFAKSPFTVTFVGEVKQGQLNTSIAKGFNFVSSQVPQEGTVSALGYTPNAGDVLYKWDNGFFAYSWDIFGDSAWDPSEPTLGVGQSALLFSAAGGSWNRSFTVN